MSASPSDLATRAALSLCETLPSWPRDDLEKAWQIAESAPDIGLRHKLMVRVALRLTGTRRAAALVRLYASLERNDGPDGRVFALAELFDQGWKREAEEATGPLFTNLCAMADPSGPVLTKVIPKLVEGDLERAFAVAARLRSDAERAEALSALLERSDLGPRQSVARMLRGLLPRWDIPPRRRTAIMESLAGSVEPDEIASFLPLIAELSDGRERVLAELSPVLTAENEATAIRMALAISDPQSKRGALSALARHATPVRARALITAVHKLPSGEREAELRAIVASLPPIALADLTGWAQKAPLGPAYSALLIALPRIPTVSLAEAVSLLRTARDPSARGRALLEIAVHAAPRMGLSRGPLLAEAAQDLRANPHVTTFLRRWGDCLHVLSTEEARAALTDPGRLPRLVWPNLRRFTGPAAHEAALFLREALPSGAADEVAQSLEKNARKEPE